MGKEFIPEKKIKYYYYRLISWGYHLIEILKPPSDVHFSKIPIIINNFNRLGALKEMIQSLESRGYGNIYIIDNRSTYPPLLDYYNGCKHKIFRLESNLGPEALWKSGIYKQFRHDFFVYSDSDIVPIKECPDDFLKFFRDTLIKNKLARKVGFSLKIDDIPDSNLMKKYIIKCEEHFFRDFIKDDYLFRAPIDTTFALYRPRGKRKHANNYIEMYRTGFPYMARHLPWYNDSRHPDEEEQYYLENLSMKTFWTSKSKKIFADKLNDDPAGFLDSDDNLLERSV